MKCNVGKVDKWIRMSLGLIIVVVGYTYSSWWGALGLILIATAMLSWCPIYRVLGLTSCESSEEQRPKEA